MILLILVAAGVSYLMGSANERTVTSISTGSGFRVTVTSSTTLTSFAVLAQTTTAVLISTTTSSLTFTTTSTQTTTLGAARWYGLVYLGNESGCTMDAYPVPCEGSNSDVVVFNCAAAAASPEGCIQRVNLSTSPGQYFVLKIWYPYINYTLLPDFNCRWTVISVPSPPGPDGPYNSYCISVNSTSFMIADQAPPPV